MYLDYFWKGIQTYMIKKVLYSIFICLASFFLMSHNASAIELTRDVNLIQGNFQSGIKFFSWNASSTCSNLSSDVFVTWIGCNGLTYLYDFDLSIPTKGYQVGDWVVLTLRFNQNLNSVSNHSNNFYLNLKSNSSKYADLVDIKVEEFTANSSDLTIYIRFYDDAYINSLSFKGELTLNPANGTSTAALLHVGETSVFREIQPQTNPDYTGSINSIENTLKEQHEQQQQQQEQEKQDTNQAIDDSKNSSNSSSSDVQNDSSTQSLLSVITGFFGAITSASPSSCVLTGQINEYLTPSFDFCQLDPPPALTALLSIPVAIALFFFAKHMLNKIVALIRSFQ